MYDFGESKSLMASINVDFSEIPKAIERLKDVESIISVLSALYRNLSKQDKYSKEQLNEIKNLIQSIYRINLFDGDFGSVKAAKDVVSSGEYRVGDTVYIVEIEEKDPLIDPFVIYPYNLYEAVVIECNNIIHTVDFGDYKEYYAKKYLVYEYEENDFKVCGDTSSEYSSRPMVFPSDLTAIEFYHKQGICLRRAN